jgi:purine-binding chemotaxis protein CheW
MPSKDPTTPTSSSKEIKGKTGNNIRFEAESVLWNQYPATNPHTDENPIINEISPDALEQILRQRAAQIARPIKEEEKGEQIELALIKIGKELFGIDVQSVLGIHPCGSITRLPRVPQWILGVTNISGHILAVLDLQSFLGLNPSEPQSGKAVLDTYLIRISTLEIELALLVDEVLAIETLPMSKIQETTDATRGLPPEYIRGIYRHEQGETSLVLILNMTKLLTDPRLVIEEEII